MKTFLIKSAFVASVLFITSTVEVSAQARLATFWWWEIIFGNPGGHQPGGNQPGGNTNAPIDGGLSLLIAAGAGLGIKKAHDRRKKEKETADTDNNL